MKPSGQADKKRAFYIVGMGGSAGSLEAFEQFFRNMPPDSGAAFILVPHLDPTHKGIMPELIQRYTGMKVFQATDGMKVKPNCAYVIPPNRDMSIFGKTLQLLEPSAPRGLRMPIDFFFRNLADDQRENAICVILSGMGTDGTLGLKAVKERLGMAMVQDPASARYTGMPQSAIDTGLADFVAPPDRLPEKLTGYMRHLSRVSKAKPPIDRSATTALTKVLSLLRARTGQDFSLYKKNTVNRRIERRMSLHQVASISQYVRFLQESPREIDLLFKELLIGVTSFFRDPEVFESLKVRLSAQMPPIGERGRVYRVWIVGCSTGEEAYSVAMVLREVLEEANLRDALRVQIYATDLDREAIDRARQGLYPANISADVPPERLRRFFLKEEAGYRVLKEIREMVVFAPQNVLMDPPFTKLDLLTCRNLLIYLTPELQKKLLPLFHFALSAGGILCLGSSESISGFTTLFLALDARGKIFLRRETPPMLRGMIDFPPSARLASPARGADAAISRETPEVIFEQAAQSFILEKVAPPVILINEKGDIMYLTRRSGRYLEPPVGKANLNIFSMARKGLRTELGIAVRKAAAEGARVTIRDLRIEAKDDIGMVNLTVAPIGEPESLSGLLMVVFEDAPAPERPAKAGGRKSGSTARLREMNEELVRQLQSTKEHLQTLIEEMEVSQEELKSTNEELQSTNEELQSTNEELSTSKEELQSLNEELITLNAELQARNNELSVTSNDMLNLLNSTQIATLFLDDTLKVRRFTPPATRIAKLIPGDVGRPITDIVSNLLYEDLASDVTQVIQTLVFRERQVQTRDGSWYIMRIHPYRTTENVIDGVVITFAGITALKDLEEILRGQGGEGFFRLALDPWPGCVYIYDLAGGRNVYVNRGAAAILGIPQEALAAADLGFWMRLLHPDDAARLAGWDTAFASVREGEILEREYRLRDAGGAWRWFLDRVSVLSRTPEGKPMQVFGIMEDITRWRGG